MKVKGRKTKFLNGKKGNAILDIIFIAIFIFGFSLSSIIGYKIFTDINTEIQESDSQFNNQSKEVVDDLHGKYPSLFDGAFLVILIFLWIGALVSSFVVDTHPIFLMLTIVLLVFCLFLAAIFSNSYESVTADDQIYSSSTAFPITDFLMGNLYIIVLVIGLTVTLVLFGKFGGGGVGWLER